MKPLQIITLCISFLLLSFIGVIGYAAYDDLANNNCGLELQRAKNIVTSYILQKKLSPDFIKGPIEQRGSCQYGFTYLGSGEHLYCVVQSTWLEGVRLTCFDYVRQNR